MCLQILGFQNYLPTSCWTAIVMQATNRKKLSKSIIHYLNNPIIHLYYPPKLSHNHCLQFLLGHENVPREVETNAYADFWGAKEVYYGICASS